MERLKYILVIVAFATVFIAARADLNEIRSATDDRLATRSNLEDVTRLETETHRFLDVVSRYTSGSSVATRQDVRDAFIGLSSHVDLMSQEPGNRALELMKDKSAPVNAFAAILDSIADDIANLQVGEPERLRRITSAVEPMLPFVRDLSLQAANTRVERAIHFLQTQKAAAESAGRLQLECLLIGIIAMVMIALELAKVRKLNIELHQREVKIRDLATSDSLTGLRNRRYFDEHLAMLASQQHDEPWHLLLVDLDGFKQINDTFGHHAGDHLLQVAAERMRHIAAGAGLAARLGGDEFAIALPRGLSDTRQMARTLIEAISRPVHYEGKELRIAASIGIASSVNIDQSTEEFGICKRADLALYAAKRAGKRQYRVFDATLAVSLPNAGRRKTDINPAETALGEVAERLGLAGPKSGTQ